VASGDMKLQGNLRCKSIKQRCSIGANEHININIYYGETINNIVGVVLARHINPAFVFGSVSTIGTTSCTIGAYNTFNGALEDDVKILVFYTV